MGQKKIATVDLSQEEETVKKPRKQTTKQPKKAVKKEPADDSDMGVEIMPDGTIRAVTAEKKASKAKSSEALAKEEKAPKKPVQKKQRSHRYTTVRSHVDRTKTYPLPDALKLLRKISNTKFDASVEAHFNLAESGLKVEVQFPHSTGKKTRVAIASDAVLKKVEKGKIDFDILLADPKIMPKIGKVAKILGPKGLMPSPKTGTITDEPKEKKKQLEGGQTLLKSEAKNPLMHVVVGKISFKDKQLADNITAVIEAITPSKITKLTLASSMSPGIRVDLKPFKKS